MTHLSPVEVLAFPGSPTAVVRREGLPMDQIGPFMDAAFGALGTAIASGAITPAGPAFSRYDAEVRATVDIEAGFPVVPPLAEPLVVGEETVVPSSLPACQLATAKYTGSYDGLGAAWAEFLGRLQASGYELGLPFWEAYDTEPTPQTDPDTLITGLAMPVTGPLTP